MKVLWLCNMMLPAVGEHLGLETSPKEGWLSGLFQMAVSDDQNRIESFILAFPVDRTLLSVGEQLLHGSMECQGKVVEYYGFYEDTSKPECYDPAMENVLKELIRRCEPDLVHIFGTEYPHTLAMTRAFNRPERTVIGVQGLCTLCATAYMAALPGEVVRSKTFRDVLKQDSMLQQQEKFVKRGIHEQEALRNVKHIMGRTAWDAYWTGQWNPDAAYYVVNESLRNEFYTGRWEAEKAEPGAIFLSQGDYPLKGLHHMLMAMPEILDKYPEAKVYVAGNSLVKDGTLKDRIKISGYGCYLKRLIKELQLEDKVVFLGRLSAAQMKEQYLRCSAYVCCSSLENSPNSLGEAMILGAPCVAAEVGGIPSLMTDGRDGVMYKGFSEKETRSGEQIAGNLAKALLKLWGNRETMVGYCENARNHAKITHDRHANYEKLMEVYAAILASDDGGKE